MGVPDSSTLRLQVKLSSACTQHVMFDTVHMIYMPIYEIAAKSSSLIHHMRICQGMHAVLS